MSDKNNRQVALEITSWTGVCIGAQHFYGSLKYEIGDEYKRKEIKGVLDEEWATRLNEEDECEYGTYKAGDTTTRFYDRDLIIKCAIETFQTEEDFKTSKYLVLGNYAAVEPQEIIAFKPENGGNQEFVDLTLDCYEKCEILGWWEDGNDDEVDKIWEVWHDKWKEEVGYE